MIASNMLSYIKPVPPRGHKFEINQRKVATEGD